jgi:phosphocarrier protein HPr
VRSIQLRVRNPSGLHARPAALFVRTAAGFRSAIRVRNLTRDGKDADAKSMLGVMTIGAARDHDIEITADGPDEEAALAAVAALIESGAGEELPA